MTDHQRRRILNGGDLIARFLRAQGAQFLFTLCGGHISPILVGCKRAGIRVVDVRHEATAVFAADAVARLTGVPGVAAVTAGPGVTNTITAVKNAQLAQSPLVLLGGATATALKGRGALQDIDQMALTRPHVKWAASVKRVRDLIPTLKRAFEEAQKDVPGPVFVECPLDVLYDESLVRGWYEGKAGSPRGLADRALNLYLKHHVDRIFVGADRVSEPGKVEVAPPRADAAGVQKAARHLKGAEQPLMLIGSQALLRAGTADALAAAVERLGVPVYLSGMARGLLGRRHPLQARHRRREALKEADLVILAGVPCDFRLNYGRHIRHRSFLISANRDRKEMRKNRRPNLSIPGDPGDFIARLAMAFSPRQGQWAEWHQRLAERDGGREAEIDRDAAAKTELINPLALCRQLDDALPDETILVGDGGDYVATASYIVRPTGPLSWLDPGVYGTLGVGAGFALGAKLCRPEAEVWILYGDGSVGFSIAEFDTFARHGLPILAVVGNDGGWQQIAREQVEVLEDDVGTVLDRADYHRAVEGLGGKGFKVTSLDAVPEVLRQARQAVAEGMPVLVNAHLGKTEFRKGSISV
jgi:acetolactate synthase-1/2/3 large subunit